MEQNNNIQPINPEGPAPTPNLANAYEALPQAPILDSKLKTAELIPIDMDIKDTAKNQLSVRDTLEFNDTSAFDSLGKSSKMKSEVKDIGRDEFIELSSGKLIPRFLENVKGIDNEERLAQGQTSTKWVQKFLGKTAVNVLGNTIGVVEGIINGVNQQSLSAVYNSDFNNYLEDLNKQLDYKLPTYYTAQEREMNFGQQLTTSNFWTDKFMGGLSFLTGTIISEGLWAAATGGTSLIGKGVLSAATRGVTKLGARGAISTLKKVKSGTKGLFRSTAAEEVSQLTASALKASKVAEGLHTARFFYTSAGYEAGVEARQYLNETKSEWERNFKLNNGRAPSSKERLEFNDNLTNTGNMLFAGNVALVGSSNMVILGKLLLNPAPTRAISNNIFKKSLFGIGYTKKAGKLAAIEATGVQKVLRKVTAIGKPVFTEGFIEEGGQAVMSTAASEYVLSGYSQDETDKNLSAIDAFAKGLHYTYGTKEGLTEVGLGSLIGLLGGAVSSRGKFNEYTQEAKQVETTVDYVNEFAADNFVANLKASNKINAYHQKSEEALAQGKITEATHADTSAAIALLDRSYHYQSIDEAVADFNTAIEVSDNATLASELNITEEEAQDWKDSKKEEFESLAKEHYQNLEFAEVYLGESQIAGLDKIEGLKKGGMIDLKSAVAYTLTMGTKSDELAQNLNTQIKLFVANRTDSTQEIDALTVTDVLRKVSSEKTAAYDKASKKHEAAQRALQLAEVAAIDAQNSIADKEDSTKFKNNISKANQRVLKLQRIEAELLAQKELAFAGMNLELHSDGAITEEMLDNQEKNLKKLEATIENNALINPQEAVTIKTLIEEYSRAATVHKNYSNLISGIVDGKTRVNILNGWAAKLINKNKKIEEGTAALFGSMVSGYTVRHSGVGARAAINEANVKIIKDFEAGISPTEVAPEDITAEEVETTEKSEEVQAESNPTKAVDVDKESKTNAISKIKAKLKSKLAELKKAFNLKTKTLWEGTFDINKLDFENNYYLIHQTGSENLSSILKGFNLQGGGLNTTTLWASKESIEAAMEAIRTKKSHRGADSFVILEFSKEEYGDKVRNIDDLTDQRKDWMLEGKITDLRIPGSSITHYTLPNRDALLNEYQNKVKQAEDKAASEIANLQEVNSTTPIGSVIAAIKAQIQHILNSDEYTQERYVAGFEETFEDAKPTEAELTEYAELTGKINKGKIFRVIILNPYQKGNKTGLTKAETDRLKVLNRKLSNWKILDGSNINGSSVAELLQLIHQLETSNEMKETKETIEVRELFTIGESKDTQGTKPSAKLSTIVTPDIAVAKKIEANNTYEISFLSATSLVNLFPNSKLFVTIKGLLVDVNTIPKNKLDKLEKQADTEFTLEVGEVKLPIKVSERQRLIIDSTELETLMPESKLRILDFGNSNYMPLFIQDAEGNFTTLNGDFKLNSIDENEVITLEGDKFYELESGDILKTVVNLNDTFNAELIENYKKGLITKEELINNINIYITTQGATNNIVGTLRAIKPSTNTKAESYAKIYRIRKQAVKKALEAKNKRVDVGLTVTLSNTFMGKPNLEVVESEAGLVPNNIPFTKESTDMVENYGYMLDGKLFLNKNLQYSPKETRFASKISNKPENAGIKIPVIAFTYKKRRVIFPVSLTKSNINKVQAVMELLNNENLSDAAIIIEINKLLISYNINPNNYKIADLESEESKNEVVRMIQDLEVKNDFVDVETWLDPNFHQADLMDVAEIAIDITDKPFTAGFGTLNLKDLRLPTEEDLEIESINILDNLAKEVELIFRDKEPFSEMGDTKFYEAYTTRSGVNLEANSYLDKRYNANLIKAAFENRIPKQVKLVLGEDLIARIKAESKQYKLLSEGLRIKTEALEGNLSEEINNIENNCN